MFPQWPYSSNTSHLQEPAVFYFPVSVTLVGWMPSELVGRDSIVFCNHHSVVCFVCLFLLHSGAQGRTSWFDFCYSNGSLGVILPRWKQKRHSPIDSSSGRSTVFEVPSEIGRPLLKGKEHVK